MRKEVLQSLRQHLAMDTHEQIPPAAPIKVYAKCIIKGPLGSWEQGAVAGYLTLRDEPYALVAYSERPYDALPQFDFVPLKKLGKFRKLPEREFKLRAPVVSVTRR